MANKLADSSSPYLLQHANNPVDWYPWGEEALARAREEQRPILLSIGYAACHWCHVMAHESFENPEIAALMNASFVNVKVDREERPDLDGIYMDAVQAMTGSGGWPMTVFLTPSGEPFFAGTYFPPEDGRGLPGLPRVLRALAGAWQNDRDEVVRQGSRIATALARASRPAPSSGAFDSSLITDATASLSRMFDSEWAGFGPAPKFPQPMVLELLLGRATVGDRMALELAVRTLDAMAAGGIHDQIGGGFHRYSTDREWLVPHFEKMLYDNAQLARAYLHAWQVTGDRRHRAVAERTLDYLIREMRHPEGGFYSSQDADSEGGEGRFFTWSRAELLIAAGDDGELVADLFGASPDGNWEGTNVLSCAMSQTDLARRHSLAVEEVELRVQRALLRLYAKRERRPRPETDDKVISAWNGLAIVALAEAGGALGEDRYLAAATEAYRFIREKVTGPDGRVMRSWRQGRVSGPGYLDDHALLASAALALYQSTFVSARLAEARQLADLILELFRDQSGSLYQTASDTRVPLARPRDLYDNAVPSGNSAAAGILIRIGRLTGESRYEEAAVQALRAVRDLLPRAPTGFGLALQAIALHIDPSIEIAITGSPDDPGTRRLLAPIRDRHLPHVVIAVGLPGDAEAVASTPLLSGRALVDGQPAAYVCHEFHCERPVTEPAELERLLERGSLSPS